MLKHLSCKNALAFTTEPSLCVLDIRALDAYLASHIPGAQHLPRETLGHFIETMEKSTPLLIYCYAGVSSVTVGDYLLASGFTNVSTLDGGFNDWLLQQPTLISAQHSVE